VTGTQSSNDHDYRYSAITMMLNSLFSLASRRMSVSVAVLSLLVPMGCQRSEPPEWTLSPMTRGLSSELQTAVSGHLVAHTGTAQEPKHLFEPAANFDRRLHFRRGQAVYMKRCVQCHGVSGDGQGPVSAQLYPRPRDYTSGVFKFTSTSYGEKPRRDDLLRTIRRGVIGTSMPSFQLLPRADVEAVVDYVLILTHRGELEFQLATEATDMEEVTDEAVPGLIDIVRSRWSPEQTMATFPLTPEPLLTAERAALGRQAFLTKGCSKCHGEDGRGHTKDNIGKDTWGHATRAADLTSGMLRGGHEPVDVYRRILNGINGTPMPGFRGSLEQEPETIWNLVAYVLQTSAKRQEGTAFTAGILKPYAEAGVAMGAVGGETE
jgi:mono/diheme cytochrome c family protein